MWFSWSNLRRVSSFIPTIASIHSDFTVMSIGLSSEWIQPFKFPIKNTCIDYLTIVPVKETIVLPWYFSQATCFANLFEWRQCWFEDKQISSHLHFTKKCAMLVYHHKLTSNTYNLHRFQIYMINLLTSTICYLINKVISIPLLWLVEHQAHCKVHAIESIARLCLRWQPVQKLLLDLSSTKLHLLMLHSRFWT